MADRSSHESALSQDNSAPNLSNVHTQQDANITPAETMAQPNNTENDNGQTSPNQTQDSDPVIGDMLDQVLLDVIDDAALAAQIQAEEDQAEADRLREEQEEADAQAAADQAEREEAQRAADLADINKQQTCFVCQCEEPLSRVLQIDCPNDHWLCRDCVARPFQAAIDVDTLYPPRCCSNIERLYIEDFEHWLSGQDNLVKQYRAKEDEHRTMRMFRRFCGDALCNLFLPIDSYRDIEGTEVTTADCLKCQKTTCITCAELVKPELVKMHTCTPKMPAIPDYDRSNMRMKVCPYCGNGVELSEGCNHMSCRCENDWCFDCLLPWNGGDDHYDCQEYNDPEYDEEGYSMPRGLHRDTGLDRQGFNAAGINIRGLDYDGNRVPGFAYKSENRFVDGVANRPQGFADMDEDEFREAAEMQIIAMQAAGMVFETDDIEELIQQHFGGGVGAHRGGRGGIRGGRGGLRGRGGRGGFRGRGAWRGRGGRGGFGGRAAHHGGWNWPGQDEEGGQSDDEPEPEDEEPEDVDEPQDWAGQEDSDDQDVHSDSDEPEVEEREPEAANDALESFDLNRFWQTLDPGQDPGHQLQDEEDMQEAINLPLPPPGWAEVHILANEPDEEHNSDSDERQSDRDDAESVALPEVPPPFASLSCNHRWQPDENTNEPCYACKEHTEPGFVPYRCPDCGVLACVNCYGNFGEIAVLFWPTLLEEQEVALEEALQDRFGDE